MERSAKELNNDNYHAVNGTDCKDLPACDFPERDENGDRSHKAECHADKDGKSLKENQEHLMSEHEVIRGLVLSKNGSQFVVVGQETGSVKDS